jgi:hypothetical protein
VDIETDQEVLTFNRMRSDASMTSFLRLDQLLENADILGIGNLDSEDFFFVSVEKQE